MLTISCNCDGSVYRGSLISESLLPAYGFRFKYWILVYKNIYGTYMEYMCVCAYYTCVYVLLQCLLAHWRVREHVAIYFNFLNSHLRRKQSHRLDVTGVLEHMPNNRGRSSNNNCHWSAADFAHQSRNDCGQWGDWLVGWEGVGECKAILGLTLWPSLRSTGRFKV